MNIKYIATAFGLVFFSCSQNEITVAEKENEKEIISTLSVEIKNAKASEGMVVGDLPSDIFTVTSFTEGDKIYISQLGPATPPQFSDFTSAGNPYCSIYEYYENEEADWDNQYNFAVPEDDTGLTAVPIDWTTVRRVGSVGNSYVFYSFFFPGQTPVWSVQGNQQGIGVDDTSNLLNSDILGAYHATSALQTRMRFQMFHLMVYLRVTLYVPVYQSNGQSGSEFSYSGFQPGSLVTAYLANASTEFSVEWTANRSSDTEPPLTYVTGNKSNVTMYIHPYDDDETMTLENVTSFYPSFTGENNEDEVMVYNFSVIFPAQAFGDNFLCFQLQDIEGNNRYYYFSGNQIVGTSGQYSLTQGTLQQLFLYLPRTANETILVGANVLPWSSSFTDMTVTEDGTGYNE